MRNGPRQGYRGSLGSVKLTDIARLGVRMNIYTHAATELRSVRLWVGTLPKLDTRGLVQVLSCKEAKVPYLDLLN